MWTKFIFALGRFNRTQCWYKRFLIEPDGCQVFGAKTNSREVKYWCVGRYLSNFEPSSVPPSSHHAVPDFIFLLSLLLLLRLQNAMSENDSVAGINLAAAVDVLGASTRLKLLAASRPTVMRPERSACERQQEKIGSAEWKRNVTYLCVAKKKKSDLHVRAGISAVMTSNMTSWLWFFLYFF